MAEYIDRDKVHEMVFNLQKYVWKSPVNEKSIVTVGADDVNFEIDKVPAADVAPVVHAKWIDTGERTEDEDGVYTCSACGHNDTHSPGIEVPHCWFCGAKTDGGEKANE